MKKSGPVKFSLLAQWFEFSERKLDDEVRNCSRKDCPSYVTSKRLSTSEDEREVTSSLIAKLIDTDKIRGRIKNGICKSKWERI